MGNYTINWALITALFLNFLVWAVVLVPIGAGVRLMSDDTNVRLENYDDINQYITESVNFELADYEVDI